MVRTEAREVLAIPPAHPYQSWARAPDGCRRAECKGPRLNPPWRCHPCSRRHGRSNDASGEPRHAISIVISRRLRTHRIAGAGWRNGRRVGLKNRWEVTLVRVRFPGSAHNLNTERPQLGLGGVSHPDGLTPNLTPTANRWRARTDRYPFKRRCTSRVRRSKRRVPTKLGQWE
jgi:hypothetical protein